MLHFKKIVRTVVQRCTRVIDELNKLQCTLARELAEIFDPLLSDLHSRLVDRPTTAIAQLYERSSEDRKMLLVTPLLQFVADAPSCWRKSFRQSRMQRHVPVCTPRCKLPNNIIRECTNLRVNGPLAELFIAQNRRINANKAWNLSTGFFYYYYYYFAA